jgi:predicted heme/steroid binding protein
LIQGVVSVSVASDKASDFAGNTNTVSNVVSLTYDAVPPTVVVSTTASSLTNLSPIPFTITFSEPVTGFAVGDLTLVNGVAANLVSVSNTIFTVLVTPISNGVVSVSVGANLANDLAGNPNTASNVLSVTYNNVRPTVVISTSVNSPTNNSPITVTITFSQPVAGFSIGDLTLDNGIAGNFIAVSTAVYTVTITPITHGSVSVRVADGVANDFSGNFNTGSNVLSVIYDTVSPSVVVSTTAGSSTNTSPIPVTITFSESVAGFTLADLTLVNATAGNFVQVSESTYTVSVTPTSNGTVSVSVGAGMASDYAGNLNTVSNVLSVGFDYNAPAVFVSTTVGGSTNSSPIPVTITFSKPVTGFALSDLTVVNGNASNLVAASGMVYTVSITPLAAGIVSARVGAGVATDFSGNLNTESNLLSVSYDPVSPTVVVSTSVGSPTNTSPIPVTITFNKPVTGFTITDMIVVNGSASNFAAVSSTVYTVSVTPVAGGTVSVRVGAGVATDASGNLNTESNVLSVSYDDRSPSVLLSTSVSSPTKTSTIPVTITFSKAVTGFTIADLTVTNGTAGNFVAVSSTVYTVSITPVANGTVSIRVAAGLASDSSGNFNTESNILSVSYDDLSPSVVISTQVNSITNRSPIPVTITFSEPVTGFTNEDLILANGTTANFVSVSGSIYTVDITPSAQGTISIRIPENSAKDAAQHGNTASNTVTVIFDNQPPVAQFTSAYSDTTFFPSFPVTVSFDEKITGFDVNGLDLVNAGVENVQRLNDFTFTVSIKPVAGGLVIVSLRAGVVRDVANNSNLSGDDFRIMYIPLPEVKIRPIITPGDQDDQNNVLVVDHIKYYKENNLKLINRWGEVMKEWIDFQNYTTSYSQQPDFNFMDLNQGEYICVLDYTNPVTGAREKRVQMIMVLK